MIILSPVQSAPSEERERTLGVSLCTCFCEKARKGGRGNSLQRKTTSGWDFCSGFTELSEPEKRYQPTRYLSALKYNFKIFIYLFIRFPILFPILQAVKSSEEYLKHSKVWRTAFFSWFIHCYELQTDSHSLRIWLCDFIKVTCSPDTLHRNKSKGKIILFPSS